MSFGLKRLVESESRGGLNIHEARCRVAAAMYDRVMDGRAPVSQFSVREAWEALVGPVGETLDMSIGRDRLMMEQYGRVRESALQTGAFVVLAGANIAKAIMEEFDLTPKIGDELVSPYPSDLPVERMAGTQALAEPPEVEEGEEIPDTGFEEKAVQPPGPKKRANIIGITAETIQQDRTSKIMTKAKSIGEKFATERERMIINSVTETGGIMRFYPEINGAPTQTSIFRSTAGSPALWYNRNVTLVTSNGLVGQENIDSAMQNFATRTDEKGNEIYVRPTIQLVPLAKRKTALQIKNGTQFKTEPSLGASVTSIAGPSQLNEIVGGDYKILSTPLLDRYSASDWFFGDPKRCFFEHIMQRITVDRAMEGDFRRDVPVMFRCKRKSNIIVAGDAWWQKNTA